MAENERIPETGEGGFKEAVCIDAMRIYDTCSAKDCLEDLRVILPAIVSGCIGAAVFSRIGTVLDTALLKKLFGALLIATGLRELLYKPKT